MAQPMARRALRSKLLGQYNLPARLRLILSGLFVALGAILILGSFVVSVVIPTILR